MTRHLSVASLATLVLLFLGAIAMGGGPANRVTFGDKPTFQTDDKFEYALSPDKLAFTVAFQGLEVAVGSGPRGSGPAQAPINSRTFSMAIPLTGGKGINTALFASGFVLTSKGANATLLFVVNDKNVVSKFGPDSNRSFVQRLAYRDRSVQDIKITAFLLVERDNPDASAFLSVNTLDTDLALKRKGGGKS